LSDSLVEAKDLLLFSLQIFILTLLKFHKLLDLSLKESDLVAVSAMSTTIGIRGKHTRVSEFREDYFVVSAIVSLLRHRRLQSLVVV
jgi:hypothetical protein